ncbi:MAG: hypothetical protein AB1758_07125, partial [Candidatus Eremiobacterota bacterium]
RNLKVMYLEAILPALQGNCEAAREKVGAFRGRVSEAFAQGSRERKYWMSRLDAVERRLKPTSANRIRLVFSDVAPEPFP